MTSTTENQQDTTPYLTPDGQGGYDIHFTEEDVHNQEVLLGKRFCFVDDDFVVSAVVTFFADDSGLRYTGNGLSYTPYYPSCNPTADYFEGVGLLDIAAMISSSKLMFLRDVAINSQITQVHYMVEGWDGPSFFVSTPTEGEEVQFLPDLYVFAGSGRLSSLPSLEDARKLIDGVPDPNTVVIKTDSAENRHTPPSMYYARGVRTVIVDYSKIYGEPVEHNSNN